MTTSDQGLTSTGIPPGEPRAARLLARLGWFALLSAVLIALFAGSFYITMRLAFVGREVAVPDLTGMTVEEAQAALSRSDLYLEPAAERYDDQVATGQVLAQDPRPGATTKKDRKVRVTVSLGPAQVTIPDVQGQSLRTAEIELEKEGLSVGHVTSTHERSVLEDVVLAQHPRAGEGGRGLRRVEGTDRVDLLVSRGRPEPVYVMPDLSRRTLAEVTAFAQRAGLRIGAVRRERMPGFVRSTVIRQYPEAGYPVGRQAIISLVLSQ